ncbi:MAG: LamG-like jellyroll fold domain-containing protein [Gammaproteobacteria bacterium]
MRAVRGRVCAVLASLWMTATAYTCAAQAAGSDDSRVNFGSYNSTFLEGGVELARPLSAGAHLLAPGAPWTMTGWVYLNRKPSGAVVIAAIGGRAADGPCRCLVLQDLVSVVPKTWHAVAATYDGGTQRDYFDGREVSARPLKTEVAAPLLTLAPYFGSSRALNRHAAESANAVSRSHFGGSLASFQLHDQALSAEAIRKLAARPPDFDLVVFNTVGAGWPWQVKNWRGLQEPQDPWTLPRSKTAPEASSGARRRPRRVDSQRMAPERITQGNRQRC